MANKKRTEQLMDIGLVFNGDSFVYEDVNVHWTESSTMDDEEFDRLVETLRPIVQSRKERNNQKENVKC